MADQPPLLGVSTSSPAPPGEPGPLLPLPTPTPPAPDLWPPAAQYTLAVCIVLFLALLGWHGYGRSPFNSRPLDIERGGAPRPVVELNTAGEADLRLLPGVGEVLARAIVRERDANGLFRSVDDLRRVHGVGPATIDRLRPYVRVDGASEAAPPPRVARGAAPRSRDKGKPPSTRKRPPAEPIDLNTATEAQLLQLPDVGPTLAARILEARKARKFTSVEELRKVKGIGPKRMDAIRPHVRIGP